MRHAVSLTSSRLIVSYTLLRHGWVVTLGCSLEAWKLRKTWFAMLSSSSEQLQTPLLSLLLFIMLHWFVFMYPPFTQLFEVLWALYVVCVWLTVHPVCVAANVFTAQVTLTQFSQFVAHATKKTKKHAHKAPPCSQRGFRLLHAVIFPASVDNDRIIYCSY